MISGPAGRVEQAFTAVDVVGVPPAYPQTGIPIQPCDYAINREENVARAASLNLGQGMVRWPAGER